MSAPQALIEFFQKEATEYLDRLDQLLADAAESTPDASAFLTHARALRGSATMTRLDGLPDLASTIERIATGLRDGELRWDQRLHFAVRGALVAALLVGLVDTFGKVLVPQIAGMAVYMLMALVLLYKPEGLFKQ